MSRPFYFAILLSFTATFAIAQTDESDYWAVVQDSDGFSNVREGAGTSFEIVGKVNHGDFVWVGGAGKGNWKIVHANGKKEQLWGYIHDSRLKPLSSLEALPQTKKNKDSLTFSSPKVTIDFAISDFDKNKWPMTIVRFPDGSEGVTEIDFKPIFGADGMMPFSQYSKSTLTIDGKLSDLSETAFKNLFNPHFGDHKVLMDPKNNTIYITGMNSDGAGTYVFLIRIVDGKYKDRVVLSVA